MMRLPLSSTATALCRRGNNIITTTTTKQVSARGSTANHSPSPHHYFFGGNRCRSLTTSSSSKAPVPPPLSTRASISSSQSKDKGQEAIDKSKRLHAELKEMVEAQKARHAAENEKPYGSNLVSFLKTSKPEILNIFFAFVCVLLAYQIHGMRNQIRKLLGEKEEKDTEIDRLRNILANLSEGEMNNSGSDDGEGVVDACDNSFSAKLAQQCATVVQSIFEQSERKVGYSWILGKKLASGDMLEVEKLIDQLHPVILSNIKSAIGDAAYTPEELKERRVAALKLERHDNVVESALDEGGVSMNSNTRKNDAQMGDLMQVLEEVHNQDLTDKRSDGGNSAEDSGSTKVRRQRYAI